MTVKDIVLFMMGSIIGTLIFKVYEYFHHN